MNTVKSLNSKFNSKKNNVFTTIIHNHIKNFLDSNINNIKNEYMKTDEVKNLITSTNSILKKLGFTDSNHGGNYLVFNKSNTDINKLNNDITSSFKNINIPIIDSSNKRGVITNKYSLNEVLMVNIKLSEESDGVYLITEFYLDNIEKEINNLLKS
jgi:glutamyl/glutaminyl-tRNA synthetase